jgi:hypothetical protein
MTTPDAADRLPTRLLGDFVAVEVEDGHVLLDAILTNAEQLDEELPPGSPITFVLKVDPAEIEGLRRAMQPFVDFGVVWAIGPTDGLEIESLLLTAETQTSSILLTI